MYLEKGTESPEEYTGSHLLTGEVDLSVHLETPEFKKPTTWEQFLEIVHFEDSRLVGFPQLYWEFYVQQGAKKDQGIRQMMDDVLTRVYELYKPEEAYEICRFYLFGTVMTQNNKVLSASGRDQTQRKEEKDSEGNLQPTIKHTTEVFSDGLMIENQPVDAATAMTLKGHDIYEDCGVYARDQQGNKHWIAKESFLDIVRNEFKYGEDVSLAILGISKYDDTPDNIQIAAHESLLYDCLEDYVKKAYEQEGRVEELKTDVDAWMKLHDDIMKTITSIFRLRYEHYLHYQKTGDREAYLTGITRDLYTKCIDIWKNLPRVSYAGKLRARQMATLARIFLLDVSNQIMHKLALSTHDALFDALQNKPLAEKLDEDGYKERKEQQLEQWLLQKTGIVTRANLGYRISFIDEAISSEDPPFASSQALVEASPADYDKVIGGLKAHINDPEMQAFIEGEGDLHIEEFSGILQKIIEVLGRRNCMYEIKDSTGQVKKYIRVIEKKPYMWERILPNHEGTIESPEDKFFAPPLDPSKAVQKFLNMQLVLFNAEYLKDKQDKIAVLVWDGGVTTCATVEEMQELCVQLGFTEDTHTFVELMQEEKAIDWHNLPQYPFYYAKKRVPSAVSQQDAPLQ